MPNEPVPARCVDLVKTYRTPTGAVHALRGVTLGFEPGKLTAVVGPSGSGKSSLLRVLTGIDRATSGDVWVGPRNVARASARGLRRLRRDVVGYVFQRPSDNFLPNLTIGEHLRLAARDGNATNARSCSIGWGSATGSTTCPTSSPVANSSARRSPRRWSPAPRSSSPTSRPPSSTRTPRAA